MTHFAHFTHGYGGNTPRSSRTLVKVVNGDTLTFTIHIRRPYSSEPVASGDARKPDVSVVLSENRFYNLIWTGTLADGDIALDENAPGVAYVTVPRDVMSALRRGIYAFSVTVDDGERRETQTRGHIQVEYEPTSATHDIPYRADAWKGDVGLSFRPPRVLTEYESVDAFPATGVKGVLYLAADTNTLYRWDGSGYSRLGGPGGSGLTEEQAELIAQIPDKLDKSDVVALSSDAVTGQAADAKATFDALAAKANNATTLAGYGITDAATKTELDEVGQRAANAILGVQSELSTKADLVDGKIPANQLPSYVDDVLEYDSVSAFPATGEDGKIYVAKDTNKTYRWGGTQYVEISQSLALGETAETAYPGDKGKAAAETAANALGTANSAYTVADQAMHDTAVHAENKENPHAVTAKQVMALPITGGTLTGDLSIGESHAGARKIFVASDELADGITLQGGSASNGSSVTVGGSSGRGGTLTVQGGRDYAGSIEVTGSGASIKKDGKEVATEESLAPEYSPSSAYAVGSFVFHQGNIYQCKSAIADGGEEWNAAHWELRKLDDFFTESNSLLTATIDARLPYPLNAVPSTGLLKDRAINTTSLASVTVPDNFTDLLVRASVASSLSVTMPEAITTKYGDTFPGEAGEYLITITKTGTAEAYVRTIKLEVANA